MKLRKALAAGMAGAAICAMMAGSASAAGKEVVIWDYFETDAQKEMMQTLIDGFNASQDEFTSSAPSISL